MAKDESKIKQSWKYIDGPPKLKSKSLKAQIEEIERETQTQANKLESEYRSVLSSGNTDKSIELLIELIYADDNTPKRRKELRELYSKQCPAGEDPTEYGYLKVMEVRWGVNEKNKNNPIKGAKRDYINYLQLQAQKYDYDKDFDDDAVCLAKKIVKLLKELLEELLKALLEEDPDTPKNDLIQWLTRNTNYDNAQEILKNSNENDLIQFAVKAFQSAYDKHKKIGNADDKAFLRVTWILASLFKKTGDTEKAIPKFIECKDFRSAYALVDIHSVEAIRFALEEFKGHDDNHVKALSLMVNRHTDLEQMYTVKNPPDNFAMKWFFLSGLYAIYRVRSLAGNVVAFAIVAFIFFASPYVAPSAGSLAVMLLIIPALVLCNDIRLHGKWVSLHQMYASIIALVGNHPQMAPLQGKFYKSLSTEKGTQKKLIIILLYFFLCMFISYTELSENKSATVQTTPVAQENIVLSDTPAPQIAESEDTSYLNARTDLSLNSIDLGISVAEAQSKLGQPVKVEHLDNHDRQYYSDGFYISVANNKVTALVTHDPKFKTRRGLHVGSTYDEIIDQYGTNSADMTVDNLTLHEYSFDTINGEHALLRFAIDSSNRVDYISIRVVDPPAPQSLGEHWIKDNNTDVYLWNPEPYGNERISWNGSYMQDGDYKFAEGSGTVTWYRDGQVIQVDEGSFEHGRHHGRFKHTLESGNVVYSNWAHGKEIIDTPAPHENTDSKGQYVGTYNSGMKAYIIPGTLKLSSDRNSCNVRIVAEGNSGNISYLDYHIWREGNSLNFSNSEGYSGVINSNMRVENKIWEIAQSLNR